MRVNLSISNESTVTFWNIYEHLNWARTPLFCCPLQQIQSNKNSVKHSCLLAFALFNAEITFRWLPFCYLSETEYKFFCIIHIFILSELKTSNKKRLSAQFTKCWTDRLQGTHQRQWTLILYARYFAQLIALSYINFENPSEQKMLEKGVFFVWITAAVQEKCVKWVRATGIVSCQMKRVYTSLSANYLYILWNTTYEASAYILYMMSKTKKNHKFVSSRFILATRKKRTWRASISTSKWICSGR